MLSVDSETTGVDLWHGARPFLVTICDERLHNTWWEWDVDPLTREVEIDEDDAREIRQLLARQHDGLVLQNSKFDATALLVAGVLDWEPLWDLTDDTLIAAHLLGSNLQKDLTALCLQFCGEDVSGFEDRMKLAVNEARRMCRTKAFVERYGTWMLAGEGVSGMPSAKSGSKTDKKGIQSESPWKFDCWLPRAVMVNCRGHESDQPDPDCQHDWPSRPGPGRWNCQKCGGHRWWIITSEYANSDSAATISVWKRQEPELRQRDLWDIYREKLRSIRALWDMERRGTTVLHGELKALRDEYARESDLSRATCVEIAASFNAPELVGTDEHGEEVWEDRPYQLELPKAGNNKSLTRFAFDVLRLPVVKRTEMGLPSLDKDAVEEYRRTLDAESPGRAFIVNLSSLRKRAKSAEYMNAYEVFGVPVPGELLVLHPSVNATGTDTTRLSMSNPNLQQVSKQESQCQECEGEGCEACDGTGEDLHSVRVMFGPGPGREWYSADARNIELRLPAFESGEPSLIELFERPDDPPFYGSQHLLNFSIVYQDIWRAELTKVGIEKVGPHCKKKYASTYYQWNKNGGLAMQYQCGEQTADRAFHRPGGYAKIKSSLIKLAALNEHWVRFANKHGFVETMPDRTVNPRRGYPLLCSRGDWGRVKPTIPLNYHVQGTAGWWMVKALNRCHAKLREWHRDDPTWDGFIALTVHDELVFDFPKRGDPVAESKMRDGKGPLWRTKDSSNLWRVRVLQGLMEEGGRDVGIPIPVSVEYHEKCWAKGVSL